MTPLRILIAGCGDVGSATALQLLAQGHEVWGLRRNTDHLPRPIRPLAADLNDKGTLSNLPEFAVVIYCAAATGADTSAYQRAYLDGPANLLAALPTAPQRLLFTSSTGVYGQHQHEWVDETSPCQPGSDNGKIMVAAEQQIWRHPNTTCVRFGGIYGPGRLHLIKRVQQGIIAPAQPLHYSNRIHRDDCAGFLCHLVALHQQGKPLADCYLGCDNQPSSLHEITQWLARQLQVTPQQQQPIGRGGSKRCANTRLQQSGYQLRYPDYRAGFSALLHAQRLLPEA